MVEKEKKIIIKNHVLSVLIINTQAQSYEVENIFSFYLPCSMYVTVIIVIVVLDFFFDIFFFNEKSCLL